MDGYVNKSDERTCNMKMKKKKMDHRQGTPPSREILKKKKKKKRKKFTSFNRCIICKRQKDK